MQSLAVEKYVDLEACVPTIDVNLNKRYTFQSRFPWLSDAQAKAYREYQKQFFDISTVTIIVLVVATYGLRIKSCYRRKWHPCRSILSDFEGTSKAFCFDSK